MNLKDFGEAITTIAAFAGMGLGFYNLLIERTKTKVNIKVKPKAITKRFRNSASGADGIMTSSNDFNSEFLDQYFAIEAVNLSYFPVVIDNVGFEVTGLEPRMVLYQPILIDGGSWPRKLDRRESVTVYGSLSSILSDPNSALIENAFVETSCGEICRGTSGALLGLVDYAMQLHL